MNSAVGLLKVTAEGTRGAGNFMTMILLFATALGICIVAAYRIGLRDGMRLKSGREPEAFIKERPKGRPTKEDKRINAILSNIDAYDGTGKNQKEII